jgi:putative transposase
LYQERRTKPAAPTMRRESCSPACHEFLEWRQLLVIVKPETLIRWHRKGFRHFWRWKSRALGRPAIPVAVSSG